MAFDLEEYERRRAADLAILSPPQREQAELISKRLILTGSQSRAPRLLEELSRIADPGLFWFVFQDHWSGLDDTWIYRTSFARILSQQERLRPEWLTPRNRAFYDGLPDRLTVYRGCSEGRIRGLSWTMNRAVAETFARGHRFIRVPNPVIASATIAKTSKNVLFFCDDRKEQEVLIRAYHPSFRPETCPWIGMQSDHHDFSGG